MRRGWSCVERGCVSGPSGSVAGTVCRVPRGVSGPSAVPDVRRVRAWRHAQIVVCGWGLSVGNVVHRCRRVVEADCPQGVNGLWAMARPERFRRWSAAFPRRGQVIAGVVGILGKNGGRRSGRLYPGCARRLSTGCGFRARAHVRADDGGDGFRNGARTAVGPAVLGISLWTRPPGAPVRTVREVCVNVVPSLWIVGLRWRGGSQRSFASGWRGS